MALNTDPAARITASGARVTACAIGQASAALFLMGASGRSAPEIATTRATMEMWLGGAGDLPDWPGIAALSPARAFPARHAAILLPWEAALAALSNPMRAD